MAKTIQTHLTDNETERWTVEDARRVFRKEMDLADMCEKAGYIKQAQTVRGQRYAVDDWDNDWTKAGVQALSELLRETK